MALMSAIDGPADVDERHPHLGRSARPGALDRGELYTMSAPAHTSLAAREIVSELRHQYLLSFEASPDLAGDRSRSNAQPDVTVRARSGYSAGGRS